MIIDPGDSIFEAMVHIEQRLPRPRNRCVRSTPTPVDGSYRRGPNTVRRGSTAAGVPPLHGQSGPSVAVGSLVEVRFSGANDTETYLFGSIEERHGDTVDVSPTSPLGVALGGAKDGDTVSYTNPAGDEVSVDVVTVH